MFGFDNFWLSDSDTDRLTGSASVCLWEPRGYYGYDTFCLSVYDYGRLGDSTCACDGLGFGI